jgi:hypothetical protein
MKEAKDVLRILGVVVLGLCVLVVVGPLVMAAAGIALGFLFSLAVAVIKIAVVLAVGYLILVGIRALLR